MAIFTKDMSITDAISKMRGQKGTSVTLYIMRDGFKTPKPFEITRAIIKIKSVKSKTLETTTPFGYLGGP